MYVCLCNPTSDRTIREQCKTGCSLKQLIHTLDIGRQCVTCVREIAAIHKEESNYSSQPTLTSSC